MNQKKMDRLELEIYRRLASASMKGKVAELLKLLTQEKQKQQPAKKA